MEAAYILHQKGHRAILVEEKDCLGGQFICAGQAPQKEVLAQAARARGEQILRSGVEVRLGVRADAALLEELKPDEVVIAAGASPVKLSIPGIKGENVYSKLKYESGSHRVQRVPVTETQGRVHTSTATVLVMPEVEDIDIDIKESDLKIDVYHSSGAGGQSVNTSNSAVRITHLPTNTVVTCQNERSQLKNKDKAMKLLKIKLYDNMEQQKEKELGSARKTKIGTGDRSEKIRTYNYPQNRVTDHRIGFSVMNLDRVMDGDLEPIIDALITEDLKRKLAGEE